MGPGAGERCWEGACGLGHWSDPLPAYRGGARERFICVGMIVVFLLTVRPPLPGSALADKLQPLPHLPPCTSRLFLVAKA